MSRRAAGVVFVAIAGILVAARYLAAAIFGSGVSSWNAELFQAMLSYVGSGLLVWSIAAAVIGGIYLIWAEIKE